MPLPANIITKINNCDSTNFSLGFGGIFFDEQMIRDWVDLLKTKKPSIVSLDLPGNYMPDECIDTILELSLKSLNLADNNGAKPHIAATKNKS